MVKQKIFFLFIIGFFLSCQPQQAENNEDTATNEPASPSIVGTWELEKASVNFEGNSFEVLPYRSVIIYTDNFYSIEIALENRPSWPELAAGENVSYDNLVNAYANLISNSGKYEIKGDSIYHKVIIAKSPNFMNKNRKMLSSMPRTTAAFKVDGDKMTTYWQSSTWTYKRVE
jgi:Lipocalin-like domain